MYKSKHFKCSIIRLQRSTVSVGIWDIWVSDISSYIHGRRMQIILDSDQYHYYDGRCYIDRLWANKAIGTLVVKCGASPYKYEILAVSSWIWNTFSFVDGVIC